MDLYGTRELTVQQLRVVRLLAQGRKNREIAFALETTENVVKNYLREIFDKTGVSTRLELAMWYVKGEHDEEVQGGRKVAGVAVRGVVPQSVRRDAQGGTPVTVKDRVRGAKGGRSRAFGQAAGV